VDNFVIYPIDILYARVDTTVMDNNEATKGTEMTGEEMFKAMKSMTTEERVAFLNAQRPDLFTVQAPSISFGKAPKSGWTEADRVPQR
jgi:hypothetical protein